MGIAHGMKAYQSILPVRDDNADAGIEFDANSAIKSTSFTDGLTLCGRFNYRRLSNVYAKIFEVSSWQSMAISMGYRQTTLYFGHYSWVLKDEKKDTFEIWKPDRWTHICLSFNTTARHLLFFKDQDKILDKVEEDFQTSFLSSSLLKKVAIGKKIGNGEGYSRHAGTMTDINIWDMPLTAEQMQDWTSCESSALTGNIVDWESSEWSLTNVKKVNVTDSQLCNADSLGPTLIPEKLTAENSAFLCQKLSGKSFVINNQSSLEIVNQMSLNTKYDRCFNGEDFLVWAGWWDEFKEGLFIDINNGQLRPDMSSAF